MYPMGYNYNHNYNRTRNYRQRNYRFGYHPYYNRPLGFWHYFSQAFWITLLGIILFMLTCI